MTMWKRLKAPHSGFPTRGRTVHLALILLLGSILSGCGPGVAIVAIVIVGTNQGSGDGDSRGAAPEPPTGVAASPAWGAVAVTWEPVAAATSYNLYYAAEPGVTKREFGRLLQGAKVWRVTSPHLQQGLTEGQEYFFVVTALKGKRESKESAEVSAIPSGAPSGLTAVGGTSEATIDWNPVIGATTYNIYWDTAPGVTPATGTPIADVAAPYLHTSLINGVTHYYVVSAVGPQGGEGSPSSEASVMPLGAPPSLLARAGTSEITLTWGPVAGATAYNIYWGASAGVDTTTGTLIVGVSSPFTHTPVPNGAIRYYVVTATNGIGGGAESNQSIEAAARPLAAPTGVTTVAGVSQITVDWNPVPAATSYFVYWGTTPGVTKATGTRVSVGAPPWIHTGLDPATRYYYVVTARNNVGGGGESAESAEASEQPNAPCFPILPVPPQGTLHPVAGDLRELIHDPVRDRFYITNETTNSLEIFDVASSALLTPLFVGAQPWGLDLTPDNSQLLVCLSGASLIAVVDVTVDPPVVSTTLPVPTDSQGTSWPFSIGCASNNLAFFTCTHPSETYTEVRQIDLSTMNITFRNDIDIGAAGIPTFLGVSGDRSQILFGEEGFGPEFFIYSAATDSFTSDGDLGGYISGVAVNEDGSQFFVLPYAYEVGTDRLLHGWLDAGWVSDVVYSPLGNRAFAGMRDLPEIGIVDPDRLQVIDRIATPAIVIGNLEIDAAGTTVCAVGEGGLLEIAVDVNRPPVVEPLGEALANVGETIGLTLLAVDPENDPMQFCAENIPANASFDSVTRLFQFTPVPAQTGRTYIVTFYASDGVNAAREDLIITVTSPASYPARKIPIDGATLEGAYDPNTDLLYVTNSTRNRVEVIRVADSTRLDPIPVGANPRGVDVNASGTKLVVGPAWSNFVEVVDLLTVPPRVTDTLEFVITPQFDVRRPGRVAISANDHALIAPDPFQWRALRDLDLTTSFMYVRTDVGGGGSLYSPWPRASGDRSKIMVAEGGSAGSFRVYDSATDSFGPETQVSSIGGIDVNEDGTRFLVASWPSPGLLVFDENLTQLGSVVGNYSVPAFRQGFPEAYHHERDAWVEVADLTSYLLTDSFNLPEPATGWMRTNSAGTRLLLLSDTGVTIVTLP